jgi:hypothetical protein
VLEKLKIVHALDQGSTALSLLGATWLFTSLSRAAKKLIMSWTVSKIVFLELTEYSWYSLENGYYIYP